MWLVLKLSQSQGRGSVGFCLPSSEESVSLGESPPLLQEAHSSGASVIVFRDFPQSLTVASPSTDLQQGLGSRIRVKDALLVFDQTCL